MQAQLKCCVCAVREAAHQCSACHARFYCSQQCQARDWQQAHQFECASEQEEKHKKVGGLFDRPQPYLFLFDLDGTILSVQSRGALVVHRERRRFVTLVEWEAYTRTPALLRGASGSDPSRSLDEVWADLPMLRRVFDYLNWTQHRYAIITNSSERLEQPIARRTIQQEPQWAETFGSAGGWEVLGGRRLVVFLLQDAGLYNTAAGWKDERGRSAIITDQRPFGKVIHTLLAMDATGVTDLSRIFVFEDTQPNLVGLSTLLRGIDNRKLVLVTPPGNLTERVWKERVDSVFLINNPTFGRAPPIM